MDTVSLARACGPAAPGSSSLTVVPTASKTPMCPLAGPTPTGDSARSQQSPSLYNTVSPSHTQRPPGCCLSFPTLQPCGWCHRRSVSPALTPRRPLAQRKASRQKTARSVCLGFLVDIGWVRFADVGWFGVKVRSSSAWLGVARRCEPGMERSES